MIFKGSLLTNFLSLNPQFDKIQIDDEVFYYFKNDPNPYSKFEFVGGSSTRKLMEDFENLLGLNKMSKKHTDTERLNWLDQLGDIGRIRINPDLEGSPFITWNHWNVNLKDKTKPSNVRKAIDLAMEEELKQRNHWRNYETDLSL